MVIFAMISKCIESRPSVESPLLNRTASGIRRLRRRRSSEKGTAAVAPFDFSKASARVATWPNRI